MKKRKRLNFLKLGVFLFGVSLLLWNCEKDIEINNLHDVSVNEKKDFTLEKLSYSDLITDGEIQKSLSKIRQRFSKNVKQDIKVQGRNTADISENFTIITDNVHKVTTKEAITWAFKIKSPVLESSDFENFLVKKHNEEFSYYLVSYEKDFEKEYENATLYSIPKGILNLDNLNLSSKGENFMDEGTGGGGGGTGCQGNITVYPCDNGNTYIHGPESYTDGTSCTGSTSVVDFSHCPSGSTGGPNSPTDTTTPDNGDSNGGGSSGGSTVTSPVTLECDNCSNALSLISYLNITDQNLINWINDPVNAKEVDAAFRFCKGNNWNTEAKTFAEQIIKAYLTNTWPTNSPILSELTVNEIAEFNWYETSSSIKVDAKKLMKCFRDKQTSLSSNTTYSLTVYIEQPVPNTSQTYSGTDPGHTFISMSVNDPNNSNNNLTQTFGYYPANSVNPLIGNNTTSGEFRDNSGHNYHVSATISLNNSNFYKLVTFVESWSNSIPQYDLQTNNCTDFGIKAGNLVGMSLPDTMGSWSIKVPVYGNVKLGEGSNPGNLGQDLRNLSNSNLSIKTTSGSPAKNGKGECN